MNRFLVSTPPSLSVRCPLSVRSRVVSSPLLGATGKSKDESLWRLRPGVLADPQVQTSLIERAQLDMQTGQAACPVLRWERSLKELQHMAYYLGLPVGRKHKRAAFQAQDLSRRMRDNDLFEAEQHGPHVEGLSISYRASADMAAMGWAGIRHVAFSAFSPIGWAADKARSYVSAIVNCLFDDAGNEVRNRVEVL